RALQIVDTVGGEIYYTWNLALPGFAARLTKEQLVQIEKHPEIASIERDAIIQSTYDQTGLPGGLWGLDRIDERNDTKPGTTDEKIYRDARRASGVHVYVIDRGIRGTHNEFSGRIGTGMYIEGGAANVDTEGHGTHVAGTIGGTTYGVAKLVTLRPVRVSADAYWYSSEAIECIEWIIDDHDTELAVANMSFGWYPASEYYDEHTCFEEAIDNLIADGVVVVCAAGNDEQ